MRTLICTIVRNRAQHLEQWQKQLLGLAQNNKDIEFDLVVYENDSTDDTVEVLNKSKELLQSAFKNLHIKTESLGWPYFASIKAQKRVKYLAQARNSALNIADELYGLSSYDKIVFIEPDIQYNPAEMRPLLVSDHDVASGYSVLPEGQGVPDWIYDSWATRVYEDDEEYFGPKVFELPDALEVASTFNCFCVYTAGPFSEGLRFSGTNPLTKTWDCDTANICFKLTKYGYDDIVMYKIPVTHIP